MLSQECPLPSRRRRRRLGEGTLWLGLPVLLGLALGLLLPTTESLPTSVRRISCIIGWTYFSAWCASVVAASILASSAEGGGV